MNRRREAESESEDESEDESPSEEEERPAPAKASKSHETKTIDRNKAEPKKPTISKTVKDKLAQDDKEIEALEKRLGIKGKNKLPKAFEEDGLADLLGDIGEDSEADDSKKRKREEQEWLQRKRRRFDAWKNRDKWVQVPWGTTDYKFKGDPAIEGKSFWVALRSSAAVLYAKTTPEGTPSRHNKLYRSYDASIVLKEGVNYYWNNAPGRVRCFGQGCGECRIIKNRPGEITVESDSIPYTRGGMEIKVVTQYRVRAGKDWFEVIPVKHANEQGMHGESRFSIVPDGAMHKCDYVVDAWKQQGGTRLAGGHGVWLPDNSRMSLDLIMDADLIWLMTWPDPFKARPYATNCWGGYPAGWQHIGEGLSTKIISAPFARFGGGKEPVVIGVLYKGYWHYQRINQKVIKDQKFTGTWKRAYQRRLPHGTYSVGSPWKPGYPGIWRTIGYIKMEEKPRLLEGIGERCEYYTQEVKIGPNPTAEFSFTCPVAGTLEYLITYLYDRTEDTPKEVSTPMDIYRQAIQGKK